MSYPFGAHAEFERKTVSQQLVAFAAVVADFAEARSQSTVGGDLRPPNWLPTEEERQRIADAGQRAFILRETVAAYALILATNGVFTEAAKHFSHEMPGPC